MSSDIWQFTTIKSWSKVTEQAAFSARSGHTVTLFKNELYLIGGAEEQVNKYRNDIWKSSDGMTWTKVTDSAAFPVRTGHTAVVFKDSLWVIAGAEEYDKLLKDVWKSGDGENWIKVVDSAAFPNRYEHTSLALNGEMYVIAGQNAGFERSYRDVWKSSDGKTWEVVTDNAAFGIRSGHTSVVLNAEMYVIVGIRGEDDSGIISFHNDVWKSSDGKTWEVVTDSAGFGARSSHTSVILNGEIYVMGGIVFSPSTVYFADTWKSSDGKTWMRVTENSGFGRRTGSASVVLNGDIYVVAGAIRRNTKKNDVWVYK